MGKKVKETINTKQTKEVKQEKPKKTEKAEKVPQKENKKNNKKEKKVAKVDNEKIEQNPLEYADHEEAQVIEDIKIIQAQKAEEVQKKLNLDKKLVSKAVKCLKKTISSKYSDSVNILANEKEEFLFLNFVCSRLPMKYSVRPVSVSIPNSIYSKKFNTRVCLFVKDPRSAFKDLNIEFPFDVKVLDVEKLKLKYSRFQERRNLLKQYDFFLCDYRIYMLLKKLLGKPFYAAKKYPIPIKLDYNDTEALKSEVISHVETSTNFYMSNGPNYSVKIAREIMEEDAIVDNIIEAVKEVLPHILKWGIEFDE
jgi:hypothetical protein